MDWFKRYGIPGAYFIILTVGWVYAFYGYLPLKSKSEVLIQLGLFLFLPIGYVISILGQLLYLDSAGLHTEAAKRASIYFVDNLRKNQPNEPDWEALSCLNTAFLDFTANPKSNQKPNYLKTHQFLQEWIRKRMDVVVINRSIEIATVLSPFLAVAIGLTFDELSFQPNKQPKILLIIISIFICWLMWASKRTLEEQIIIIISGAWKKLGFKFEGILSPNTPYPNSIFFFICFPEKIFDGIKNLYGKRTP